MQVSVFDYRDYKTFVHDWITARPGNGRGEKSRIAEHLRCHTAYVTHVFGGDAHLSLEQACELSRYLGLRTDEQHFFLCLVQLGRAANTSFRDYIEGEIRKVLEARLNLKNRLQFKEILSENDQSIYYSAWYYSAVYALVSVPRFNSAESLSRQLGLPLIKIAEILEFLLSCGLITLDGEKYRVGKASIHLANDSPMITQHHVNWRMQAIHSLDLPIAEDLHYSSVVSLSECDAPRVRAVLVKAIEEVRTIVRDSPEEKVCAYSLDFFGVSRNKESRNRR